MRIRVIDIECTGIDPKEHAVCEIGWCDVVSTKTDLDQKPYDWIVDGGHQSFLINPGRTIPAETSAVHHLIDEDVITAPKLSEVIPKILQSTDVDVLAAHSAKFERSFLSDDMTGGKPWICTYKCALRLWKDELLHSNQALRYSRRPEGLDRNLAMVAHRAGPDAYVTAFLLRDMLNTGPLVEHMITRSAQPALQVYCHVGKFRGKKWSEVDSGFLIWLLDKDFDEDVLFTAQHHLKERERASNSATTNNEEQS